VTKERNKAGRKIGGRRAHYRLLGITHFSSKSNNVVVDKKEILFVNSRVCIGTTEEINAKKAVNHN